MKIEQVAKVCYECTRVFLYEATTGHPTYWDSLAKDQKEDMVESIKWRMSNPEATAVGLHDEWVAYKKTNGWVYGDYYSSYAKESPLLIPYLSLPRVNKIKLALFLAAADVLIPLMKPATPIQTEVQFHPVDTPLTVIEKPERPKKLTSPPPTSTTGLFTLSNKPKPDALNGKGWYIETSPAPSGPYTTATVVDMFKRKVLLSSDRVWKDQMTGWQSIANTPELYTPSSISRVEAPKPKVEAPKPKVEAPKKPPVKKKKPIDRPLDRPPIPLPPKTNSIKTQWYYLNGKAVHGPHGVEYLVKLIGEGDLTAADLVWRNGFSDWTTISQTDELKYVQYKPKTPLKLPPIPKPPLLNGTAPPYERWYYLSGETAYGPHGIAVLHGLVMQGRLADYDLVWRDGMEDWQALRKVDELRVAKIQVSTPLQLHKEDEEEDGIQ